MWLHHKIGKEREKSQLKNLQKPLLRFLVYVHA
jgi:hypothetical protein